MIRVNTFSSFFCLNFDEHFYKDFPNSYRWWTSDKDGKLAWWRDVSLRGYFSLQFSQTEEAPERVKRLSTIPISRLCLMFWNKFFPLLNLQMMDKFEERKRINRAKYWQKRERERPKQRHKTKMTCFRLRQKFQAIAIVEIFAHNSITHVSDVRLSVSHAYESYSRIQVNATLCSL